MVLYTMEVSIGPSTTLCMSDTVESELKNALIGRHELNFKPKKNKT